MSRVGRWASSPRVAAASNPANDRKPNTTPRNTSLTGVPGDTENTLSVNVCPPRRVPGQQPDQHDRGHDQDQRDRGALHAQQHARAAPGRHDRQPQRQQQRHREQHERRPGRRVVPDADLLQERGAEDAGRGGGDDGVEGVGAEQPPAGDYPGPRAERGADERVHRARVVEVLAQPDEGVGHQEHADGRDEEGQRHGAARVERASLRVDVRGHARRHQRDGQAHRCPHRQRTLKPRCAGRARFHLLLLTVLDPHSVPPVRPPRKGRKVRNNGRNQQFPERARARAPPSLLRCPLRHTPVTSRPEVPFEPFRALARHLQ